MRDESRSAFSAYTPNGAPTPGHSGTDGISANGASANGHAASSASVDGANGSATSGSASNGSANGAANPASSLSARIPPNLAVKCPNCKELLVGKDWEKDLRVCKRCGHHFRLSARERIGLLLDPDSFREFATDLLPSDPLRFVSRSQPYREKLASERENTGLDEAVIVGRGRLAGVPVVLVVMDFRFIGGSMGTVVGEKITRGIETAAAERVPLIVCVASGGARMQEGLLSLMQMAKTSAALARLAESGVPYVAVLTDPTTGGVAASFAFLGDVIVAEPGALIGFAGPRVIEQAIHSRLPKDVNTSEFVLARGMIDGIVHRKDLRPTLARILRMYSRAVPVHRTADATASENGTLSPVANHRSGRR